ncbi:MAG: M14 family zinc carboxypeptidase [Planctomycetota bacterium]|nr:M14 family zinc carboxypeptidase [Planctomycetota bacterium]
MLTTTIWHPFAVALILACRTASPSPQEPGVQEPPALEDFDSIRFGDPEELAYTAPFFPGASYDPAIPTPDEILGQMHGTRLSHHAEILECFRRWDEVSDRISVAPYAVTHEGRELIRAVITSATNQRRLDRIKTDLSRLHDPRGLDAADAERIVTRTPPVAWLGYSIHGDELSGCDAAIAVGYHLVASRDDDVSELLEGIVVVIDPCQNPDGRERIISMVEQSAGYTPNLDYASMQRGRWPYGRGNHYLFDLNRDWMAGTQPETRGRWTAALQFHPQLFVDAHEMGSLDTYLFYPQEDPLNTQFPPKHRYWHGEFGAGIAQAFDAYGWGYYTREWADGWAPFYTDAWASLIGAVGILYEQASTSGFPLRRESGSILTYREAVHHQVVASMANLRTLAERRAEVLRDYLANKRRNVAADTPGNDRVFALVRGRNRDREAELVRILTGQGVEVFMTNQAFSGLNAVGALGDRESPRSFPPGTIVVPARQPMAQLVKAYLEFDPRLDKEALQVEREDLERRGETRMYDLTAWSLPHALDLDAWWCDATDVSMTPVTELPPVPPTPPAPAEPVFGWVVDGSHDSAVRFAVRAMEQGLAVHLADEPFSAGGINLPRWSLLVRRHENAGTAAEAREIGARVNAAAASAGAVAIPVTTGRSPDEGPDLGGQHFHLLERPRVAVLGNSPVSTDRYGHIWHHLDRGLGVPFSILDAQQLRSYDLRRFNVLVVPPGGGGSIEEAKDALKTWVSAGGTLIACADSAAAAAAAELSSVVLRRDALDDLEPYRTAVMRERAARNVVINEAAVWGDRKPLIEMEGDLEGDEEESDDEVDEERDRWMRRFSPNGVSLLAEVDTESWLTAGSAERMPVLGAGSRVFLSKPPVATPIRLAPADDLRLGGLLWPEARERLGDSAWLAVESHGEGQVILFAATPAFRGYHLASARLLANAIVYGPGMGASHPIGW